MYLQASLLALAVVCNAASPPPQTFVDTFEDKPQMPIEQGVINNPVGIENGLFYNGFVVGTDSPVTHVGSGIIAQSQPNVAAGGFANSPNGTTTITVDYPGSKVKSFDLLETYYGCSVFDPSNVGAAEGCVLAATGFYSNGQRVSTAAIAFGFPFGASSATGVAAQPMQRYVFPGFFGLHNVTFGFSSIATAATTTAFFQFDNVKHTNYYS